MELFTIGAFIEHESRSQVVAWPVPAYAQTKLPVSDQPSNLDLDALEWGRKLQGPSTTHNGHNGWQTPATPPDLEGSVRSSPSDQHTAEIVQSASNQPQNRWRLAANALIFFTNGFNDAAPGALIPYMERDFAIGYAIVSLVFVTNAIGFISAAPLVQAIDKRYGRARAYMIATGMISASYVAVVCDPPFPVVVLAFLPLGMGIALTLAMNNVFCANLANRTTILGFMHGGYGVGGTVAPLVATSMVSHGARWSLFYVLPLVLALFNMALSGWSFKNYEKDSSVQLSLTLDRPTARRAAESGGPTKGQVLKQTLKNRTTLLGALFIFAYQGAEVSISGWVISFLITYRGGKPSQVGYVTAAFWGGIAVGRFTLPPAAHKIGERIAVAALVIGAAAFQLIVWLVPNVIGDAVAVSIVGLLLGPVYPCATSVFSRLLPRSIQMSSLGFVSAMGSSGGAVAPFFTGLLAQKVGTVVLNPICIGLFVVMELSWFLLPKEEKRTV